MKSFNVLALDTNFNIVGIVAYTSLQWSRKWHECGMFSLSVPIEQYSSNWKYIYTKDRPELGKISQINYVSQNGRNQMYLSGYFLEKELDNMIVYNKPEYLDERDDPILSGSPSISGIITDYFNAEHLEARSDIVAHAFFNGFKKIHFYKTANSLSDTKYYYELDIADGTTIGNDFKIADHYRNNEELGYKIYDILKPSGASYRIRFDFDNLQKYFDVIAGKDKTQDSTTNNPIVFSTKYGNVINPNIVFDDNSIKNAIVTSAEYDTSSKTENDRKTQKKHAVNVWFDTECNAFMYLDTSVNPSDYKDYDLGGDILSGGKNSNYRCSAYKNAVFSELKSALNEYNMRIINIEFNTIEGSYEYITDFDLGDLVSLEIPEIKLSADVRLIGCYEVIQEGKWTLSLEFGTPIIK